MMLVSYFFADKIINHFLRNTSQTPDASLWLAMLRDVPLPESNTISEVPNAGDYARVQITFSDPNGTPETYNSTSLVFNAPLADWATSANPIVAVAVMDQESLSGGNWLLAWTICPKIVLNGDPQPRFEINGVSAFFGNRG